MRALAVSLVLALLAAVLITFCIAPSHGWWLPENVTSFGARIDGLFYFILWILAFFLVLTLGLLAWCVWRYGRAQSGRARVTHGNLRLELVWTLVPGAILLFLALVQMGTWAEMKFDTNFPKGADGRPLAALCEVWASQFEWRMRYAGVDGELGTSDDVQSSYELVVPAHEPVVLALRSRDVIHSFFVPNFRLKQDIVPGRVTSIWFQCDKEGSYDLICAQLCGWGHYKMAGRVRALSRADYDAWLAGAERALWTNGQDEKQ